MSNFSADERAKREKEADILILNGASLRGTAGQELLNAREKKSEADQEILEAKKKWNEGARLWEEGKKLLDKLHEEEKI